MSAPTIGAKTIEQAVEVILERIDIDCALEIFSRLKRIKGSVYYRDTVQRIFHELVHRSEQAPF